MNSPIGVKTMELAWSVKKTGNPGLTAGSQLSKRLPKET